jgi:hypothetical protein
MKASDRTEGAVMKQMKAARTLSLIALNLIALSLIVLGAMASAPALAWHHGGHARIGVFIGGPIYPWYYPSYSPYYYPPAAVAVPADPAIYVERGSPQAAPAQEQQSPGYWYYCAESKTYYPYVKECSGRWQRVTPQPQN